MDSTELHYLSYDPDELWREMQYAYVSEGGDILYPGDEKEMLLRAVQAIVIQAFASVDNALRMATLRYATGEYLDLYGAKRNCYRIEAQAATATVEVTFAATGLPKTIPAGTALTVDGTVVYQTLTDIVFAGYAMVTEVDVECAELGTAGNGLTAGTMMQFVNPEESVTQVKVKKAASGGMEAEEDEAYRERIRVYGLSSVTTGPSQRYESEAMNASSEIIDARALNNGAGKVGIYLILAEHARLESVKPLVLAACNGVEIRPLTDDVEVLEAEKVEYTLKVKYQSGGVGDVANNVAQAVREYQDWQDNTIGRAFNPDRLIAMLYQAGAARVEWGEESRFNGGSEIKYTEIEAKKRCHGTITTEVIAHG